MSYIACAWCSVNNFETTDPVKSSFRRMYKYNGGAPIRPKPNRPKPIRPKEKVPRSSKTMLLGEVNSSKLCLQ